MGFNLVICFQNRQSSAKFISPPMLLAIRYSYVCVCLCGWMCFVCVSVCVWWLKVLDEERPFLTRARREVESQGKKMLVLGLEQMVRAPEWFFLLPPTSLVFLSYNISSFSVQYLLLFTLFLLSLSLSLSVAVSLSLSLCLCLFLSLSRSSCLSLSLSFSSLSIWPSFQSIKCIHRSLLS